MTPLETLPAFPDTLLVHLISSAIVVYSIWRKSDRERKFAKLRELDKKIRILEASAFRGYNKNIGYDIRRAKERHNQISRELGLEITHHA